MSGNAQRTPLARALERFADRKVRGWLDMEGQALPASVVSRKGAIVTVKFEVSAAPYTLPNVTVPMIGSEYVRLPIGPGTLGWVMTADAYLGGVSGLGGGTADLTHRGNLSMLVWSPIGNKGWSDSENENAVVIYGPDGVIIRNTAKTKSIDLTAATGIVVTLPAGESLTVNGNLIVNGSMQLSGSIQSVTGGTYLGDIQTAGNVTAGVGGADQVGLKTHVHPANGQPPTPGT